MFCVLLLFNNKEQDYRNLFMLFQQFIIVALLF